MIKFAFLLAVFCNVAVDIINKIYLQNIVFKIFDGSEQIVWISIINALILLPFIMLFSFSGHLSDRYNKRDILVYGSISSFILSILMIFSYLSGNFYLAMANLLLLAIQSTIYSPAKFGIIINIWGKDRLAKGNSYLQGISIIAILLSIAFGSFVFEKFYELNNLQLLNSKNELLQSLTPLLFYAIFMAFLEMLVSLLFLRKFNIKHKVDKNSRYRGFNKNIKTIFSNKIIFLSVIGLSIFWAVSQGVVAVFPAYLKEYLNISDVFVVNGIIASSGLGIALGSFFYSKLSKHYIEIGTIPFASIGMTLSIYFSTIVETNFLLSLCFLSFGFFGGLFIVPLNSLIQFNSKRKNLGKVLAGNNWFHSVSMLLMLVFTTFVALFDINSLTILYLILLIAFIGTLFTIYKFPQSLILFFLKFILGMRYDLEVFGIKNIPSSGGALLLGNHVSWIDWAIIMMASPREVKFVMHKPIYDKWYLKWLLKLFKIIPISQNSSKQTIKNVAKELDKGNLVVIFPEGSITRNGHLGEIKKGFELILKQTKTDVPVIAFYIRGLWESMFSRANKKYKKSKRNNIVTISFSKKIKKDYADAIAVKKEIKNLSVQSWSEHINRLDTIPELIFDRLKQIKSDLIFADTTGTKLSGYKFLTASILFKDLIKKSTKGSNIGVLLPSSCAGAFLNNSILMLGKTVVNLNFTASKDALDKSIKKANIQTVLTSKKFMEKLKEKGVDLDFIFDVSEILYVEDLKEKINKPKALITLLSVITLPSYILKRVHIKKVEKNSTALIMFSSGSEGTPKGIELTHQNVVGNAQQIAAIINVNDDDTIVGSLPFFHAFGTVVTLFLPLIEGIKCVSHSDPTDGYAIGKLTKEYKATILLGTSTFFRLYVKNPKVKKEMFESLRLIVAGAEKLSLKVKNDFKNRFDKEILEGYGVTETTPVASCNLPNKVAEDGTLQIGNKEGTVGLPIPGTKFKIVDPNSFEELKVNEEGMILICGLQVMKGYLEDEKKTNEVLIKINNETYYVTGDKGRVDEDGFLTIVDRYSRFAKIAGEMVSLASVEESIRGVINSDLIDIVATTVKDDKKGEKIVLLISGILEDELKNLQKDVIKNLDNKLMIPSIYKIVETVPKLGSGKTDFFRAKIMANE